MIGGGGRVSSGARRGISGRVAAATVCALLLAALVLGLTAGAIAAVCGGSIPCQCGDTVGSNYLMTADLGPCPRLSGADTVGLRVRPGVTLDCQDHSITGPGDLLKDSFGIRVGTSSGASNMTVRRCDVSRFWWGIHVDSATDVLIDSNHLHDNGWKDPDGERHRLRPRRRQLVGRDGPEQPHHRQRQRGLSSLQLLRRHRGRQCLPRTTAASSSTSSTPTTT